MGGVFSRRRASTDQFNDCNSDKVSVSRNCDKLRSCNLAKRFLLPMELLTKQFFGRKGTLADCLGVPRQAFIAALPEDVELRARSHCIPKTMFGSFYQMYKQGKCSLRKGPSAWFNRKSIYNQAKPTNNFALGLAMPYLAANTRCTQATSSMFKTLFGSIIKSSTLYPTAFYKKFAPTLLRSSPNTIISVMLYEQMRTRLMAGAKANDQKL